MITALDAFWGYWEAPIKDENKEKTTFTSNFGTYRFAFIKFGSRNAPTTFQHALDTILSEVQWKTCLAYIDDVVIFNKRSSQYFADIGKVPTLL